MEKSLFTQRLDRIQSSIDIRVLKPNGFRKKGRTHNRITIDNLIQVITFQIGQNWCGDNDIFFVQIGIRVPESFERTFEITAQSKSIYHDYECNIRTTINEPLGYTPYLHRNGIRYNAKCFLLDDDDSQHIIDEISEKIEKYVFPLFDDLDTRRKIIDNRQKYHEKYRDFDLCATPDLDEAMIHGSTGNIEKATQLIQHRYDISNNRGHQEYLIKLSRKLGIILVTS